MLRSILLLLATTLLAAATAAQSLTGTIVDVNAAPIAGVTITLSNNGGTQVTNALGVFTFPTLQNKRGRPGIDAGMPKEILRTFATRPLARAAKQRRRPRSEPSIIACPPVAAKAATPVVNPRVLDAGRNRPVTAIYESWRANRPA